MNAYLGNAVELPARLMPRGLSAIAFIKAAEGVIESVSPPRSLPDTITNMQLTGKPKDISGKPLSWRAREGSLEFFWKDRQPRQGFDEHLTTARSYAETIYRVSPAARR